MKKQQEETYGKNWTEAADTMNMTNSVFENMNERNEDEQSHRHKIQNNKNNMHFNKFED